jgi:hypothetical protein
MIFLKKSGVGKGIRPLGPGLGKIWHVSLDGDAPFCVRYFDQFDYAKSANRIESPWARKGGWALSRADISSLAITKLWW